MQQMFDQSRSSRTFEAVRPGVDVQAIVGKANDADQVGHGVGATFVLYAAIPIRSDDLLAIAHNKLDVIEEPARRVASNSSAGSGA